MGLRLHTAAITTFTVRLKRGLHHVQKPNPALGETSSSAPPETVHVIILLHGIRTRAFWYDLVRPILSEIDGIVVKPLGYDYFSAFRLVFPFFRHGPANKIAENIRAIEAGLQRQNKRVRLSVIAHSFGTYTIASILQRTADIDLHHLVLCGSVLPKGLDFGNLGRKIHGRLVNDAGSKDIWPVMAKIATFGYGPSGTFGFENGTIEDRYHDFTHSDFFAEAFIREYWFPIFEREELVPSKYVRKPSWRSSIASFLASLPTGTLLVGLVAAAAYFAGPVALDQYKRMHVTFVIDRIDQESAKPRQVDRAPVVPPGGAAQSAVGSDDDVIARIIRWEGGYSPGDVSNGGITLAQWSAYSGTQANADTIRNLTSAQITGFYRDAFLQRPGVKDIANIAVKGALVNMMVLFGEGAATRSFQSALNDAFQVKVPADGVLGPYTVAAINSVKNPAGLIEAATCARLNAIKGQPSFERFRNAWTLRLRSFMDGPPTGICPDLLK
jgi:hypothetical protein